MIDIVIPSPGESISEVRLGAWKRGDGEWVEKDDVITEIEVGHRPTLYIYSVIRIFYSTPLIVLYI